jgi:hypothetical protein
MKRHGNLFEKIIDPANIELAYRRARRGKSTYFSIRRFEKHEAENLGKIRKMLIDGRFTTSPYHAKTIHEPKTRTIYVLPFSPDRIVQHAVMNVIIPIWTELFIHDTYACITGRGVHAGSRRAMEFVRSNRYCLQCDISKFYPSINHEILKKIVRRKIKCEKTLWLLDDIIDSYPGPVNTPIGNLTSQWFGNLYMNELDQYAKNELKIRHYIRYCDDYLAFSDDKAQLHKWGNLMQDFVVGNLGLRLSRYAVFPTSHGVDFLGYRHFRDYILLRKRTVKRMRRRLKAVAYHFCQGAVSFDHFRSVLSSVQGWMQWACTRNLKWALGLDDLKNLLAIGA